MNRTVMWIALLAIGFLIVFPAVVLFIEPDPSQAVKRYFRRGIDLQGGTSLLYEVGIEGAATEMGDTINVLIKRVDPTGTKNYVIRPRVGGDRLEIIMAGADAEEVRSVKSLVGRNGYLDFRICAGLKNMSKEDAERLARQRLEGLPPPPDYEWLSLQYNSKVNWQRARDFIGHGAREFAAVTREQAAEHFIGTDCVYVIHKTAGPGRLKVRTQIIDAVGAEPKPSSEAAPPSPDDEDAPSGAAPAPAEETIEVSDIDILVLANTPRITGQDFANTRKELEEGRPIIQFAMKDFAKARLGELTGKHVGERMAIVLDGKAQSAPSIRARLTDGGIITGYANTHERDEVLTVLQSGTLDVSLRLLSERTLGPELGEDNIRTGLTASLIALICVVIFMGGYYLFAGLVADLAVLLNILIIILVMYLMGGTWTLPGVAGLILTVGMSVDANVLVYERIREELSRGSSLRLAVNSGYARAMPAIIDGNLTTILTAVILAFFGSPEVQGFAIVLIIGLICSMLTAVVATRAVFEFLIEVGLLRRMPMLQLFRTLNFPFTRIAKIAFVCSMVLVAGGIVLGVATGDDKYAMEFNGGTLVELELSESTSIETVRSMVARLDEGYRLTFELQEPENIETVRSKIHSRPGCEDAIVLLVGAPSEEGLGRRFSVQVFKAAEGQARQDLTTLFPGIPEPVAVKASLLGFGYAGAIVQPIEFQGQERRNIHYSVQVLSTDDETVKQTLREAFRKVLRKTGEMEVTIHSALLTPDMVLQMQGAAPAAAPQPEGTKQAEPTPADGAAGDGTAPTPEQPQDAPRPAKLIRDEYLKYVGALRAEIDLVGETASPQNIRLRIDRFLREQAPDLAPVSRELMPGRPDPAKPRAFGTFTVFVFDPRLSSDEAPEVAKVKTTWDRALRGGVAQPPALRSSKIDKRIGKESWQKAMMAIFVSLLVIIAYIWFRFAKISFGFAAVVALVHDVCISLGVLLVFSWLGRTVPFIGEMKIDLPMIGAFLTLIGYSLNDTIVVFDRIRENRGKFGELSESVINNSINQTLGRTILTGFTTWVVVVVLFFFGGVRSTVHGFSFIMAIGVLVGTYSSIAIASPILLWLRGARRRAIPGAP